MSSQPVRKVCEACGSSNVRSDAWAVWDEGIQPTAVWVNYLIPTSSTTPIFLEGRGHLVPLGVA